MEDRFDRVRRLIVQAHEIVDEAIETQVTKSDRTLAGLVILFSGGNDSTTLAHIFRERATHAAHANTGIGIEKTRQYVRDVCDSWNLPLIEKHPPPGCTYRELILDQGFPGPAHHWKMYQRLKERCLEQVRSELVKRPHQQRVVFLAGRRSDESDRRKQLGNQSPIQRKGSMVWASPIVSWTKLDLNTYRMMHPDVPRNEVSDLLHMSGECLCGSFAHPGELEEIGEWFPDVVAEIRALEQEVENTGKFPAERCRWGWGAYRQRPSKVGPMCSSCDSRFTPLADAA